MFHWSGNSGSAASVTGVFGRPLSGVTARLQAAVVELDAELAVDAAPSTRLSFERLFANEAASDSVMTTPICGSSRPSSRPPA